MRPTWMFANTSLVIFLAVAFTLRGAQEVTAAVQQGRQQAATNRNSQADVARRAERTARMDAMTKAVASGSAKAPFKRVDRSGYLELLTVPPSARSK